MRAQPPGHNGLVRTLPLRNRIILVGPKLDVSPNARHHADGLPKNGGCIWPLVHELRVGVGSEAGITVICEHVDASGTTAAVQCERREFMSRASQASEDDLGSGIRF